MNNGITQRHNTRQCPLYWFTLAEVMVAMAVTSLIMLGMASAMLFVQHALPNPQHPAQAMVTDAHIAEQLVTELEYAESINSCSAHDIEFTVSDRDHDLVPETIAYAWSGTPGDPLTRQYNGGTMVPCLDHVQSFELSYEYQILLTQTPEENESDETRLIYHTATVDLYDYTVKDAQWFSQYFFPSLPADTIHWKVTRVEFNAKSTLITGGVSKVQLQLPTAGGYPSGQVIEEWPMYELSLPLVYLTFFINPANVYGLSPEQGLCLVFEYISGTEACDILGQNKGAYAANRRLAKSDNHGATWSTLYDQSLLFWVYGTMTTASSLLTDSTYRLRAVNIKLQTDHVSQPVMVTSARVLNSPEVTP